MKESKAVYVTRHKIRGDQNIVSKFDADREYRRTDRYDSYSYKNNDFACQFDSKRDGCTCRNIYRREEMYFSKIPKQVYAYHGSRSFTDVGVGSVKVLQRRKVRRVYLPETDDRGVGNSDFSAYAIRRTRPIKGSFYDHKKTSSKCVGGIIEYNTGCVISEKLSPIVNTKSGTTSPKIPEAYKNIEIGSNTVVKKVVTIGTQFEIDHREEIVITKKEELKSEITSIKVSEPTQKYKKSSSIKKLDKKIKNIERQFSSDSLVQHVHNLEVPSEDIPSKTSLDPMENKLEREYRRIFVTKDKDSKPSCEKPIPEFKSASILRRRFDALRRGLTKKDDLKKSSFLPKSSQSRDSTPSHKDASVTSDPPSLEGRSYSDTKRYTPIQANIIEQDGPRINYRRERDAMQYSTTDSDCQGVKGMFKLWGKKFNLEEDYYNKKQATPMSSYNASNKSEKESVKKKPELETKKEKRFFFFKKKPKEKAKGPCPEPPKTKAENVTAGRCEITDGLTIKMGKSSNRAPPQKLKTSKASEEGEEITRKRWLRRFLSSTIESARSVNVRWNNTTYATSSSTVFELLDTVYKNTEIFLNSFSGVTSSESYYRSNTKNKVNFMQDIEAWMIPKTIPDRPTEIPMKIFSKKDIKHKSTDHSYFNQKLLIDQSKPLSHRIKVVLHSNNLNVRQKVSSEYLRIDIPKDFFDDLSSEESKRNLTSDEEVYKIVEYETDSDSKYVKINNRMEKGDNPQSDIKVIVNVKDSHHLKSKILETVIKRPPMHRDVIIQGSNVNIPKRCDVIGVGIITQRDLRERRKPILRIQNVSSSEESEPPPILSQKKCEFAESYLQEYYKHWTPLGLDFYSCVSDSQLKSSSEKSLSIHNQQGDGCKSCPNICDDYAASAIISSCETSSCCYNKSNEKKQKFFSFRKKCCGKEEDDADVAAKRMLPKDSLEVFKKRKIYALANKAQWNCVEDKPVSVPSNESKCEQDYQNVEQDYQKGEQEYQKAEHNNQDSKGEVVCHNDKCPPSTELPHVSVPNKNPDGKKHVSMPDCETMYRELHRHEEKLGPGILAFKGATCPPKKVIVSCPKPETNKVKKSSETSDPNCIVSCLKKPNLSPPQKTNDSVAPPSPPTQQNKCPVAPPSLPPQQCSPPPQQHSPPPQQYSLPPQQFSPPPQQSSSPPQQPICPVAPPPPKYPICPPSPPRPLSTPGTLCPPSTVSPPRTAPKCRSPSPPCTPPKSQSSPRCTPPKSRSPTPPCTPTKIQSAALPHTRSKNRSPTLPCTPTKIQSAALPHTRSKNRSASPPCSPPESRSDSPPRKPRKNRSASPPCTPPKKRSASPPRTPRKNRSASPPCTPPKKRSASPPRTPRKNRSASPPYTPPKKRSASPPRTPRKNRSAPPPCTPRKNRSAFPPCSPPKSRSPSPPCTPPKSRSASPPCTPPKKRSASPPRIPRKNRSAFPPCKLPKSRSPSPPCTPPKSRSPSPPRTPRKNRSASPPCTPRKNRSAFPPCSPPKSQSASPPRTPRKNRSASSPRTPCKSQCASPPCTPCKSRCASPPCRPPKSRPTSSPCPPKIRPTSPPCPPPKSRSASPPCGCAPSKNQLSYPPSPPPKSRPPYPHSEKMPKNPPPPPSPAALSACQKSSRSQPPKPNPISSCPSKCKQIFPYATDSPSSSEANSPPCPAMKPDNSGAKPPCPTMLPQCPKKMPKNPPPPPNPDSLPACQKSSRSQPPKPNPMSSCPSKCKPTFPYATDSPSSSEANSLPCPAMKPDSRGIKPPCPSMLPQCPKKMPKNTPPPPNPDSLPACQKSSRSQPPKSNPISSCLSKCKPPFSYASDSPPSSEANNPPCLDKKPENRGVRLSDPSPPPYSTSLPTCQKPSQTMPGVGFLNKNSTSKVSKKIDLCPRCTAIDEAGKTVSKKKGLCPRCAAIKEAGTTVSKKKGLCSHCASIEETETTASKKKGLCSHCAAIKETETIVPKKKFLCPQCAAIVEAETTVSKKKGLCSHCAAIEEKETTVSKNKSVCSHCAANKEAETMVPKKKVLCPSCAAIEEAEPKVSKKKGLYSQHDAIKETEKSASKSCCILKAPKEKQSKNDKNSECSPSCSACPSTNQASQCPSSKSSKESGKSSQSCRSVADPVLRNGAPLSPSLSLCSIPISPKPKPGPPPRLKLSLSPKTPCSKMKTLGHNKEDDRKMGRNTRCGQKSSSLMNSQGSDQSSSETLEDCLGNRMDKIEYDVIECKKCCSIMKNGSRSQDPTCIQDSGDQFSSQVKDTNPCCGKSYSKRLTGIFLKKNASKKNTCPKEHSAWESEPLEPGIVQLNSRENITIKLKQQSPSTEEIREGMNVKVKNESGRTLYERRDYSCGKNRSSICGHIYDAKLNRISNPVTVTNLSTDTQQDVSKTKSEQSLSNLVEIQFKLRIVHGDKTTEINIGKEEDQEEKKEEIQNAPEVYSVKNDEKEEITDVGNPKNDISIKITVKNYKPKSEKCKSEQEKRAAEEYYNKISHKFNTVSTGYSDIYVEPTDLIENVFSVHRATINLTSSTEKSKTYSAASIERSETRSAANNEMSKIHSAASNERSKIDSAASNERSKTHSVVSNERSKTHSDVSNDRSKIHSVSASNYVDESVEPTEQEPSNTKSKTSYTVPSLSTEELALVTEDETTDTPKTYLPAYDTHYEYLRETYSNYFYKAHSEKLQEKPATTVAVKSEEKLESKSQETSKLAKKELLKKVFQRAHSKPKSKGRVRQLREMLKIILTDSSTNDELTATSNEPPKQVNFKSTNPNYFKDTDSINDYKMENATSLLKSKTSLFEPNNYPTKENSDDTDEYSGQASPQYGGCMCSKVVEKMKDPSLNISCCCRKKTKQDGEVNCDLYEQFNTTMTTDTETQRSIVPCKVNSNKSTNVPGTIIMKIKEVTTNKVKKLLSPYKQDSQINQNKKYIRDDIAKLNSELNDERFKKDTDNTAVVNSETKRTEAQTEYHYPNAADILQCYETKKAVLEIYAEKTYSQHGEHLVAKLPKFLHDKESEIEKNYDKIATNSYMSICTKNLFMMSVGR